MKKLICLLTIVFSLNTASAELYNIVALVNDQPITLHEFKARRQMIVALNNIDDSDPQKNKQIDKIAIKSLIDDSLLYQSAKGRVISDDEINEAMENIEERNKMQKGQLVQILKSKSVDINSFKSQIGAELIKMNIVSSFSKSVFVSPKEINTIILATNSKDAEISAQIFTSKDKEKKTLLQMWSLQKRLKNCQNVKENLYKNFATMELVDQKLSSLNNTLATIIKDLNTEEKSGVFEMEDGFKLLLICNKKVINMTVDENNYIVNILANQKMSRKAQKYLDNMRKKAYIKVFLPL